MAFQSTDLLAVGRGAATHKATFKDVINGVVSVGATPPTSPVAGQLWLNPDNGVIYAYSGSVWVGHTVAS
jgi:hypothetical protein